MTVTELIKSLKRVQMVHPAVATWTVESRTDRGHLSNQVVIRVLAGKHHHVVIIEGEAR